VLDYLESLPGPVVARYEVGPVGYGLARLMRSWLAGELSLVRVAGVEEERFRDLARCREDARADLMGARHRLSKFLLRRAIEFPGAGRQLDRLALEGAAVAAVGRSSLAVGVQMTMWPA
jgi:hypothetical protein